MISQEKNSLQAELPVAEVEKILQTGAKEVHDHGIVVAFRAEPTHKWNADATSKSLVHFGFILQLRMLCFYRFQFDGNLFTRDNVDTKVDIA